MPVTKHQERYSFLGKLCLCLFFYSSEAALFSCIGCVELGRGGMIWDRACSPLTWQLSQVFSVVGRSLNEMTHHWCHSQNS